MSHFSTDVEDPLERIKTRRKRIDKRIRVLQGEQLVREEKERDDAGIERQVAETSNVLERLTLEGNELVSSVSVAGATREVSRRNHESREATARAERLATEAESTATQLGDITEKWGLAEGQCDVLELHNLLQQQTRRCEILTLQKEAVATQLRQELSERDVLYEQTIQEQDVELGLAAERVDQQVTSLKNAHLAELELLEAVIERTRGAQVGGGETRWSHLWQTLQETQRESDEARAQLAVTLARNEDALHEQMAEKVHAARVKLQEHTQTLGLELQGLRASCILNAEKMKINTELLRSRDQEARVLRAGQKRRMNKLQDKLRALQAEVKGQQAESTHRRQTLRDKVKRLQSETKETQPLSSVAQVQLKMIATHGAKQAVSLVKQILAIDEVLHTEQLCLPWEPPPKLDSRLSNVAVSVSECKSVPSDASATSSSPALNEALDLLHAKENDLGERGVQHVMLESLLESAHFLAPEHPGDNLEKIPQEQKTLVQLADCLSALGVETETDLQSLFSTLRVFTRCLTCQQHPFLPSIGYDSIHCKEHKCNVRHEDVLCALKQFSATRAVQANIEHDFQLSPAHLKRGVDKRDEMSEGWDQFLLLLPENLEQIWDNLQDGLTQHLIVLQDRHELNTQVGKLQAQNHELRRLLKSYVNNKPRRNNQH